MNLAYLIVPVIVGLVIGASVFIVQHTDLTGYLISTNTPPEDSDNEIPQQTVVENETKCPISCDDENPCTIDWCNETSNYICSYNPINGTSEGCWGNPTICSTTSCISGKCVQTAIPNCCGDNVCGSGENCNSCAADCGACYSAIIQGVVQPPATELQSPAQENQTHTTNATTNQTSQAPLTHIIISEVQTGPNEFIELYNPTDADIDVAGWYLSYFSSNREWNDAYRNWVFPNNTILKARKFFLINIFDTSSSDWTILTTTGNPYSQGQISNNGSVALFPFNPRTKTSDEAKTGRIDALGWGNPLLGWGDPLYVFESSPATAAKTGKSLQRTSLNADTDNNSQDFTINDNPSPRNSMNQ